VSHYEPDSLAESGDLGDSGHVGPWPAFVDLFAATSLVFLVFFTIIAFRYVVEVGDGVRVKQLFERLKELEKGRSGFTVRRDGPDVLVTLEEHVAFPSGESTIGTLKDSARKALRDVYRLVDADTSKFKGLIREIDILGHADPRGDALKNWQLSSDRAVSVAKFYVDLGGDPCRIVPSGHGAYFPRDPTINPDTIRDPKRFAGVMASDRRIEVLLRPAMARREPAGRKRCGPR